jgi:double-stranded uracil-DNA glycosylase
LYGLKPVIDHTCRVLIVGSFPSAISLTLHEYYANPRNHFWNIMEVVLGMPPGLPYTSRIAFLLSRGIGLWDVVGSCTRVGSSDTTIRDVYPASLGSLLFRYPLIRTILCNGRKAESGLEQALKRESAEWDVRLVNSGYLPSSSPAHAVPFEEKCKSWMIIREIMENDQT